MIRIRPSLSAAALGLLALAGLHCGALHLAEAPPPPMAGLVEVDRLPLFADDSDRDSMLRALEQSRAQLDRLPPGRTYALPNRTVTVAELRRTLDLFRAAVASAPPPIDWTALIAGRFQVLRAAPAGALLFTGYYEPELRASRERSERFRYPLYQLPSDLVDIDLGKFCSACAGTIAAGRVKDGKFRPYYTRAEIERGALAGREQELAWLDDPIDAFFLHVQGSGLLRFDDGTFMRVSYAGSNGRPYRSIGKILVERGAIPLEDVSLQSLEDYLRAHPQERDSLLDQNERYIFFRPVPVGPIGSMGVPLTPGRSIAVDPKAYPLGALSFIRAERPGVSGAQLPLARFVFPQDTGAAITGPARVDVFWGSGKAAERIAGPMRSSGELYLLLAR